MGENLYCKETKESRENYNKNYEKIFKKPKPKKKENK